MVYAAISDPLLTAVPQRDPMAAGPFWDIFKKGTTSGAEKKQEDGSINSWPSVAFVILVFFPGSQGKTVE